MGSRHTPADGFAAEAGPARPPKRAPGNDAGDTPARKKLRSVPSDAAELPVSNGDLAQSVESPVGSDAAALANKTAQVLSANADSSAAAVVEAAGGACDPTPVPFSLSSAQRFPRDRNPSAFSLEGVDIGLALRLASGTSYDSDGSVGYGVGGFGGGGNGLAGGDLSGMPAMAPDALCHADTRAAMESFMLSPARSAFLAGRLPSPMLSPPALPVNGAASSGPMPPLELPPPYEEPSAVLSPRFYASVPLPLPMRPGGGIFESSGFVRSVTAASSDSSCGGANSGPNVHCPIRFSSGGGGGGGGGGATSDAEAPPPSDAPKIGPEYQVAVPELLQLPVALALASGGREGESAGGDGLGLGPKPLQVWDPRLLEDRDADRMARCLGGGRGSADAEHLLVSCQVAVRRALGKRKLWRPESDSAGTASAAISGGSGAAAVLAAPAAAAADAGGASCSGSAGDEDLPVADHLLELEDELDRLERVEARWDSIDREKFVEGVFAFRRNFERIRRQCLPHKSHKDIVAFFYKHWKFDASYRRWKSLTLVGRRVLKPFTTTEGSRLYLGLVSAYYSAAQTRDREELFHVIYEDGDTEDLNRNEIENLLVPSDADMRPEAFVWTPLALAQQPRQVTAPASALPSAAAIADDDEGEAVSPLSPAHAASDNSNAAGGADSAPLPLFSPSPLLAAQPSPGSASSAVAAAEKDDGRGSVQELAAVGPSGGSEGVAVVCSSVVDSEALADSKSGAPLLFAATGAGGAAPEPEAEDIRTHKDREGCS